MLGGRTAAGQGVATDILETSARAYMRALSVAVRRAETAERDPEAVATP